jgi:hypothetical protein
MFNSCIAQAGTSGIYAGRFSLLETLLRQNRCVYVLVNLNLYYFAV